MKKCNSQPISVYEEKRSWQTEMRMILKKNINV